MALFSFSVTLLPPPACITPSDNEAIGPLVVTRLVTKRGLAPGRLRLASDWRSSLTTTMRMVARVHHRSTNGRATTHVTRTPGLTDALILMVNIAYLPDGRHAEDVHVTLLTRRQTQQRVVPFFRHQLRADACAAHNLTAATTLQLYVVNGCAGRYVFQWQGITWLDVCFRSGHHLISDLQAHRCQNVTLLAIQVMQEGDARRTVRIIFDRRHPGWNAQLVALEIDQAISTLGTTTTRARCDLSRIVAPGMLFQPNGQRFLWPCFGNLLECRNRHAATPSIRWSILSNWHLLIPNAFNASIVCPSRIVTIAFFHSRATTGRGADPRRLIIFALPGIRMVLTETTFTWNSVSTARRTSTFVAVNATLKVYLFSPCSLTDSSVMIPWRSISVISTVSPPRLRFAIRLCIRL